MKFTQAQDKAIRHPSGNLQIIACAGSGKTEVVARRVAFLLGKEGGLQPENIVAFTFTDKAAAELKDRIVTRCREELGETPGMADLYVGTIHAFALDLLKGEEPNYLRYSVLSDVQQTLFVDRNSQKSGLTASTDLTGKSLRRYVDTGVYTKALSILREASIDHKALAGNSVMSGLDAYRELLHRHSYLDYSGILEEAVKVLKNDDALRLRLASRIRCVIVDEYQDINPIQEAIIRILHTLGATVTVVGDDDQTIYQWRGSDVSNILTFAKRYQPVEQVRLDDNFRSSEGIVETARAFIEQNNERLPKKMQSQVGQQYEPGDLAVLGFDNPAAEAQYIADTIRQLYGTVIRDEEEERGISWSDMAILLRTVRKNGAPITSALSKANIPYVIVGMNSLFEAAEADAARQLFYFLAGRIDDAALRTAWQAANLGATLDGLDRAVALASEVLAQLKSGAAGRFEFYNLQRLYTRFLEAVGLREELVPEGQRETVFYNLGKFSQVISDFETIHYHSKPQDKYEAFANFLEYRAEDSYPEGAQSNQYINPDAVRIMTVHQAKGMQWPVVFIPAVLRNRFPSKAQGGRNVWHLLPKATVSGADRFQGTLEDERRLFYVALTRSQKFLHVTYAPVPESQLYQRPSDFIDNLRASKWVKRKAQDYSTRRKQSPQPRKNVAGVVFSFSDLKYFFECPYQFKLRILYGFNVPLHEALGYGKSLHDALAEVHARAARGEVAIAEEASRLVQTHLHTPYAYPDLRDKLRDAAERVVGNYLRDNQALLSKVEFSEKTVELSLGDGISIVGRIDLVRRLDTNETTIVDLKSSERVQVEEVTELQLHVYAIGYQALTGRRADYVETYELEERKKKPRPVDDDFINEVQAKVRSAADALRKSHLPATPSKKKCSTCDYLHMCTQGKAASETGTRP